MTITTTFIQYDTDGDIRLAAKLPQNLVLEFDDIEDVEANLADRISDETGFCVFACDYVRGNTRDA